jgi:hypothetical protein
MNPRDKKEVLGDDEMTDGAGTDREEALCDGYVIMLATLTSNVASTGPNLRPRRRSTASE